MTINAEHLKKIDEKDLVYPKFKYCYENQHPFAQMVPSERIMLKLMIIGYIKRNEKNEQKELNHKNDY